jgi:structural maintenance of chromosome 1
MDAISFVLGIKSTQLRSNQLKELIFYEEDTASVSAFYQSNDKTIQFKRSILSNGSSEFKINEKTSTFKEYLKVLENENILVKARNFLVFQGDVEQVASQSPLDLTRLIEQISGSIQLKSEYEELKNKLEVATENSTINFNKKRQINQEMKQFNQQKGEATKYEKLKQKRQDLIQLKHLCKIYHLQNQFNQIEDEIQKNENQDFIKEKNQLNQELATAKQKYAKMSKRCIKLEKHVIEKEREIVNSKPDLLENEQGLKHCLDKLEARKEEYRNCTANLEKQKSELAKLQADLLNINTAIQEHEKQIKGKKKGIILDKNNLSKYNKLYHIPNQDENRWMQKHSLKKASCLYYKNSSKQL